MTFLPLGKKEDLWYYLPNMSGSELSNFDADEYRDGTTSQEVFLTSTELELADRINIFRLALENDRSADTMSHCFTFNKEDIKEIYLSDHVKQLEKRHGDLHTVIVETHYLSQSSGISFELRMEFLDNLQKSTWLSIIRPYNASENNIHNDVVSLSVGNESVKNNQSYEINAFTSKEFNRCLGSIVYSSPQIDQSIFDSYNWHQDNYVVMTDNFRHAANSTWSHYEYFLSDIQGGHAGLLSYFKTNEDVSEIRLSKIIKQDAEVYGQHMNYSEKMIEMSLPLVRSSFIELLEHSIENGCTTTQIRIPTKADYTSALDFVNQQIDHIKSIQIERFNDETTQPFED